MYEHEGSVHIVGAGPEGPGGASVTIWDARTGELVRRLETRKQVRSVLAFHTPGGEVRLAAGCDDAQVIIWDPERDALCACLPGDSRHVASARQVICQQLFETVEGRLRLVTLLYAGVAHLYDLGEAPADTGALRSALKTG
jgi:WD40 repeat protein